MHRGKKEGARSSFVFPSSTVSSPFFTQLCLVLLSSILHCGMSNVPVSSAATPSTTRLTRSTNIFNFLSLTPEIVNNILLQLEYKSLSTLLSINKAINPLVKRILFNNISLELGSPKNKERLALNCLESTTTGKVGEFIRNFRIGPPLNNDFEEDYNMTTEELIKRLTPVVQGLNSTEVDEVVGRILENMSYLVSLQIEVYLCTRIEGGDNVHREISSSEVTDYDRVVNALSCMSNLRSFNLGVQHSEKKLEILSNQSYQSPYIHAFSKWTNLNSLDLWGTYIGIPQSIEIQIPTYQLRSLNLSFCTFESDYSLSWLFGTTSSESSALVNLTTLTLTEIEFQSDPFSSSPLLSIFYPTCSFSNTLTSLSLYLRYPFTLDVSATPSLIFTSFTSLKTLELAGAGITTPLLTSLLPSPLTPRLSTPSSTLKNLTLDSTTSLPLSFISNFFKSSASENPMNWSLLRTLYFALPISNARTTSWESMKSESWSLTPRKHWREILRWSRGFNSNRIGKKLKLLKNGLRVEDWGEESNSEEEEEDNGTGGEDDGDELWEPDSEGEVVEVQRVEEDSDSD